MLFVVNWNTQKVFPLSDAADEVADEIQEFEDWVSENYTPWEIFDLWDSHKSPEVLREEYAEYERDTLREWLDENCSVYEEIDGKVVELELNKVMPRLG